MTKSSSLSSLIVLDQRYSAHTSSPGKVCVIQHCIRAMPVSTRKVPCASGIHGHQITYSQILPGVQG